VAAGGLGERFGELARGTVWSDSARILVARFVERHYGKRGRIDTKVAVVVVQTSESGVVNVTIHVLKEGGVMRLGQVHFRSDPPLRTKERVLLRGMKLHPGDLCDPDKLTETMLNWARLDYFEPQSFTEQRIRFVKVDDEVLSAQTAGTRDLIVDLDEKLTGQLKFSLGTSSGEDVFGEIRLAQRNFDWRDTPKNWSDFWSSNSFVGGGQHLELVARLGSETKLYTARFAEPWFLDRPMTLRLEGHELTRYDRSFKRSGPGASIDLAPRFGDHFSFSVGYAYNDVTVVVDPYAAPSALAEAGSYVDSSLLLSLKWDFTQRDRPGPFGTPYNGWNFVARGKLASDAVGSDRNYFSLSASTRRYWTLARNASRNPIVLSVYARVGWAEGFDGPEQAPLSERFAVGGPLGGWALKGFERRSLSPLELNGLGFYEPIGGGFALVEGLEMSFPLWSDEYQSVALRGILFYEGGYAWASPDDFDVDEMRHSIGAGFKFGFPQAGMVLSLYYSYPFRAELGDDRERFQWSLSTSF